MSLLFSKVAVIADDMCEEFRARRHSEKLLRLDCAAYEDFTDLLPSTCEVTVRAEVYLYGESENASEEELAELERRLKDDPELLGGDDYDAIETVRFSFEWNTDEMGGHGGLTWWKNCWIHR